MGYRDLHRKEELEVRGKLLWTLLADCRLCPRECGVDRIAGETGFCNATSHLRVASYSPHFGEERVLVGKGGSGTIFLSHCNLACVFCQNWDISHRGEGKEISIAYLASMMLQLQLSGCSNINMVTPTHYAPQVVLALDLAAGRGLQVPLVWNTSGWESREVLALLDGVVDIYLADFKYMEAEVAKRLSDGALSYPEITQKALIEMNRQVGVARPASDGLLHQGLIIRHLVMPGGASGSTEAMRWIASNLPKDTYVNIMMQYRPAFRARHFKEINRQVSVEEYREVVKEARSCGLTNLDIIPC